MAGAMKRSTPKGRVESREERRVEATFKSNNFGEFLHFGISPVQYFDEGFGPVAEPDLQNF
jgi:hypothetical protein